MLGTPIDEYLGFDKSKLSHDLIVSWKNNKAYLTVSYDGFEKYIDVRNHDRLFESDDDYIYAKGGSKGLYKFLNKAMVAREFGSEWAEQVGYFTLWFLWNHKAAKPLNDLDMVLEAML